jgi:hypothetical protein
MASMSGSSSRIVSGERDVKRIYGHRQAPIRSPGRKRDLRLPMFGEAVMNAYCRVGLVAVASVIGLTACAAERRDEGAAPVVSEAEVAITPADEGTSYNGWWQDARLYWPTCNEPYWAEMTHWVHRDYGDSTRGGGACYVQATSTGCSSDSTCVSLAQSTFGGSAYGYCYQGACYSRPGSQSTFCVMNPNRTDAYGLGTYLPKSSMYGAFWLDFALGCMTKTAGPNTACGGTNSSLYMRTLSALEQTWDNCP